jgi:hypothetical protein
MSKSSKTLKETATAKKNVSLSELKKSVREIQTPCSNCYNQNFVPEPIDYLDLESVVVPMITNYQANQYQLITNPSTTVAPITDDARSVHFSLSKLKSFIFEIERLCCERGCNEVLGDLGIRFYYGAYNLSNTPMSGLPLTHNLKHTLVLVPTFSRLESDGTTAHVDFSPDRFIINDDGTASCTPESLDQETTYTDNTSSDSSTALPAKALRTKKAIPKKEKKIMVLIGGFNDTKKKPNTKKKSGTSLPSTLSTMMNHGSLIPPPSKDPGFRYTDATLLNC